MERQFRVKSATNQRKRGVDSNLISLTSDNGEFMGYFEPRKDWKLYYSKDLQRFLGLID